MKAIWFVIALVIGSFVAGCVPDDASSKDENCDRRKDCLHQQLLQSEPRSSL
jgi:hypothetical protein